MATPASAGAPPTQPQAGQKSSGAITTAPVKQPPADDPTKAKEAYALMYANVSRQLQPYTSEEAIQLFQPFQLPANPHGQPLQTPTKSFGFNEYHNRVAFTPEASYNTFQYNNSQYRPPTGATIFFEGMSSMR